MSIYDKIIIITKKTVLEEVVERYGTRSQAKFYIEHMGLSFDDYETAHEIYHKSLDELRKAIPLGMRVQEIERGFLPTFTFGNRDLVITLGPDGLVVNTAKYLDGQHLLAFNPDPARIDGVLIPFAITSASAILPSVLKGNTRIELISMAKASLNNGQTLYAVNDLFIGQKTHVSARYNLRIGELSENQSSSGIIVSTGAGSTGWLQSVINGAYGIVNNSDENDLTPPDYRFDWDADYLIYSIREPFVSKTSKADHTFGIIDGFTPLEITSHMPQNGVIFSDGIENDFLDFNSGSIARITLADKKLLLISSHPPTS